MVAAHAIRNVFPKILLIFNYASCISFCLYPLHFYTRRGRQSESPLERTKQVKHCSLRAAAANFIGAETFMRLWLRDVLHSSRIRLRLMRLLRLEKMFSSK